MTTKGERPMMPFKQSTLAIAVAAVVAAPTAMASEIDHGGGDYKANVRLNLDANADTTSSHSSVKMEKETDTTKDVNYSGNVSIDGEIEANSLGMAVIDNTQLNDNNDVVNNRNDNDASVDDNAFQGSSGNVGANVAAGDNNTQSNAAALAAADAGFVFGHGDAEVFSRQDAESNLTVNIGADNSAALGDSAFRNATGNLAVNVASGNSNAQQNNFAGASGAGSMGEAGVSTKQVADHNTTTNDPSYRTAFETLTSEIDMNEVGGSYDGDVDQSNNVYPDNWSAAEGIDPHNQHGSGPATTGHSDFDDRTQTTDSDGDNAPLDEDGAFEFEEAGDIALSGTASVSMEYAYSELGRRTSNDASIDGNAMRNASGNIGVNLAAGSNNLQSNSLSLTTVGPNGGNGGNGVEQ